jgi:adenylosuccinate synthase
MKRAYIVTDLGFGDAGKGATVDYLTRCYGAHLVVRHNGGAQARHAVTLDDGQTHTFSQFGSGTLAGAATHLSRFMMLDPMGMRPEYEHLLSMGVFPQVTIDEDAPILTPWHRALNRMRELARGDARHGSCGLGIGELMQDILADKPVLRAGDLRDRLTLDGKIGEIMSMKAIEVLREIPAEFIKDHDGSSDPNFWIHFRDECLWMARQFAIVGGGFLHHMLERDGTVIFEGAQGVLLDQDWGFHPYTTWSSTTSKNAETLLREAAYDGKVTRLGLLRAYATRHGPGPFPTESEDMTRRFQDSNNPANPWQGAMRFGHFDCVAARYAIKATGGVDGLVISCLDELDSADDFRICTEYRSAIGTREVEIPLKSPGNLLAQSSAADFVAGCKPVLQEVEADHSHEWYRTRHLNRISSELGVPVAIISTGPAAKDRSFWSHAFAREAPVKALA